MRVLGFVHLSTTLPSVIASAPILTGAAVLAIALALSACGAPQRVQLTTAPITLPSASAGSSSQALTARSGRTATPHRTASTPVAVATSRPPLGATVSSSRSPAAPSVPPLVDATCGNQPAVTRPTSILLACADGSLRLEKITYSSYGATSATGHAVMHANTCRPNCAGGSFRDYPATLVLDDVVTSGGSSRFSKVTLHYAAPGPDGRTVASYPIQ